MATISAGRRARSRPTRGESIMTRNAQVAILLTIVGFMTGMATGYWYWLNGCQTMTAAATRPLENVIRQMNQRMDSSRGPIFPIPLAKADRKQMRDVVQKFTTDLNGNLYMLVPIPTSAQVREVKSLEETERPLSPSVAQKDEAAPASSEPKK